MSHSENMDENSTVEQFLQKLAATSSDQEKSWLSLQFNLLNHSANVRAAVFAAAIPYWFDTEMLSFLLGFELSSKEKESFLALPYIERYDASFLNVHEKTRSILRQHLKEHDNAMFKRFSRKAAAWARKNRLKNVSWIVEGSYHSVMAGERGGEALAIETAIELFNSGKYSQLEALTRHILDAADDKLLEGKLVAWSWVFICSLDLIKERLNEAESAVKQIKNLSGGDGRLLAEANLLLGQIRMRQGHPKEAVVLFKKAADSFELIGRRISKANAITNLGVAMSQVADLKSAALNYSVAKKIYISARDPHGQAICECREGEIKTYLGDYSAAEKHFKTAMLVFKKSSNKEGVANCLMNIGQISFESTKFEDAEYQYKEALSIYESLGSDLGRSNILRNLGELLGMKKLFEEADELIRQALVLARELGDGLSEANCLRSLGINYLASGKASKAYDFCSEAHNIFVSRGLVFGEISCLLDFAQVEEEQGRFDSALKRYLNVLGETKSSDVPTIRSVAFGQLAQYHFNQMELGRALMLIQRALDSHVNMTNLLLAADIKVVLGDFSGVDQDLAVASRISDEFPMIRYMMAKVLLWKGDAENASRKFLEIKNQEYLNNEALLWKAVSLALTSENFDSELTNGLSQPCRISDLKRFLDQLSIYGNGRNCKGLNIIKSRVGGELMSRGLVTH